MGCNCGKSFKSASGGVSRSSTPRVPNVTNAAPIAPRVVGAAARHPQPIGAPYTRGQSGTIVRRTV